MKILDVFNAIEIDREEHAWSLYEVPGHGFVLSVICGSVGVFEINIVLDLEEQERFAAVGRVGLEMLAEKVRNRPSDYRCRHVDFREK